MADDDLRTERGLVLPARALDWSFSRSGGPGGQHVNTSSSKATLVADLRQLQGFATVVERVVAALGPEVRITSQTQRSQLRNRAECIERLTEMIERASAPPAPSRRASRPTRGSIERRLTSKRKTSETKRGRRGDW